MELFKTLEEIITQLVLVKPEERMYLQDARKKLDELDKFAETKAIKFFLLSPFFQSQDNPNERDETTQILLNMGLINDITSSRLFTSPTIGDEKKLTQRDTNLCVSFSAMRLLSYALVEFLERHFTGDSDVLTNKKDEILKYPENSGSSKTTTDNRDGFHGDLNQVPKKTHFIHKLIAICCGVISPRSLNGLNHCYLDNDFQTASQEQNIRKLLQNKLISISLSQETYWKEYATKPNSK